MAQRLSYLAYVCISLCMSGLILLIWVVLHFISNVTSLLPQIFRLIRHHKHQLCCYDVKLGDSKEGQLVLQRFHWMLKLEIVILFFYIWQSSVFRFKTYQVSNSIKINELLEDLCSDLNNDCFGASTTWEYFIVWDPKINVCDSQQFDLQSLQSSNASQIQYIACIRSIPFDMLNLGTSLAVAYALATVFNAFFEVLVAVLVVFRHPLWCWVSYAIALSLVIVWLLASFIPPVWVVTSGSVEYAMLLVIPSILYLAASAASNLKSLQQKIWKAWVEESRK